MARRIMSDTVGFISDLPTHLVAAFRATLEEVVEADLILHVRDISHPDTAAQARGCRTHPAAISASTPSDKPPRHRGLEQDRPLLNVARNKPRDERPALVSALTGEGLDRLLGRIEDLLARGRVSLDVVIDRADGEGLAWAYRHAEVMARLDDEDGDIHLTLRVSPERLERVRGRFVGP
jgi:GTP-binding protein HflX